MEPLIKYLLQESLELSYIKIKLLSAQNPALKALILFLGAVKIHRASLAYLLQVN
jgi:hypothetical protein